MEKLIELLREYNRTKEGYRLGLLEYIITDGIKYEPGMKEKKETVYRYELEIISKKYEFIKWLVDNDKIVDNNDFREYKAYGEGENYYLYLISELAVSDNPIQDLIDLIKTDD